MRLRVILPSLALLLVLASLPAIIPTARLMAQGVGMLTLAGGPSGLGAFGRPVAVPAYLKSTNITTHATTNIKLTPGVLGCVVVNTLGGTSDKIILYNSYDTSTPLASIDTTTSKEFCYGLIFSGELVAVTSGSGTAADITVTYR